MKTALIVFGDFNVAEARRLFAVNGIKLFTVQILSPDDDIGFKRSYETFRDTADALVISDGAEFDLKEAVAGFSGTALAENENARKVLETHGYTRFAGALMPLEATLIPNENGEYQGFAIDEREFTLIVLPKRADEFFPSCEKYVIPYLTAKAGVKKSVIFKCFGKVSQVENLISGLRDKADFRYDILNENGDITVSVFFDDGNENNYRTATREIAFALKDICYTDGNVSPEETLFTLLKLGGKKISVAESFTGGKVAERIISNPGASECFYEGVVAYSGDSKAERLKVDKAVLASEGAVSAKVAYEMAAGLFASGKPDVVLATTGLAGPESDGTGKPVGLCFIAAGTRNGIHVYRYVFSGNRKEITEQGVNAALFAAIKILKQ